MPRGGSAFPDIILFHRHFQYTIVLYAVGRGRGCLGGSGGHKSLLCKYNSHHLSRRHFKFLTGMLDKCPKVVEMWCMLRIADRANEDSLFVSARLLELTLGN